MTNAPERIWIEDEFGEGDDDQWTYGTWDARNYIGYDVEYVRADIVQVLTAERDKWKTAFDEACDAWQKQCEHEMDRAKKAEAERDRLREALWAILACETLNANSTVTRMASITKAALKGETP